MGRSPCCSKEGLNRGAWTAHEDKILTDYIRVHGEGRWRNLPKRAGLKRCGKSCRLRWLNYLRPDIKRGNISPDEEELIIRLHKLLGNRWSLIAGRLPGRTDNEIKNYWNTNLGKKFKDHQQTTSVRKLSSAQQPNQKNNSKNPKNPCKKTSQSAPLSPKVESQKLIRTKATKCSKVFINPRPQISTQLQNNSKPESEVEEPLITDSAKNSSDLTSNQILKPDTNDIGFLSFTGEHEHEHEHKQEQEQGLTSDLLVDFNMGEICLSDLLNSDFSDVGDFSCSNNNSEELSPSPEHQPLVFSDEMFQDWTQSNFSETNAGSNLQSLTSFLESSVELLEEE